MIEAFLGAICGVLFIGTMLIVDELKQIRMILSANREAKRP